LYKQVLYSSLILILFRGGLSYCTMGASASFKELSRVIGQYESDGGRIQRIEAETPDRESETGLAVTLDVPISLCSGEESGVEASLEAATITDDGGLQIEFAPSMLPELDDYVPEDASIIRNDARVTDDGTVVATFTLTFDAETGHPCSEVTSAHSVDSQTNSSSVTTEDDEKTGDETEPSNANTATTTSTETTNSVHDISEHEDTSTANGESTDNSTDVEKKLDAARNDDLPPYEDGEYLQSLYDSFDTFAEMAEHIDMDVSSETVRRYMTEAGIHEPSSYETADEAAANDSVTNDSSEREDTSDTVDETDEQTSKESPEGAQSSTGLESEQDPEVEEDDPIESVSNTQLAADGLGLPDDLTIEELADALESSMTLYDVQRQLDLSRERTQKLLEQLDLIDLVMQRISHSPDQQVTREKIANRIRSSAISG